MSNGGKSAAIAILGIVAVAALGLSGYMFVNDTFLGGDEHEHDYTDTNTGLMPVAIWNSLYENLSVPGHASAQDYLVGLKDPELINTEYVNVFNDTHFAFVREGIYQIQFNALLDSLIADQVYWGVMLENDTFLEFFDRALTDTVLSSNYYHMKGNFYLNVTDLNSVYCLNVYGTGNSGISITQTFNQVFIEYYFE